MPSERPAAPDFPTSAQATARGPLEPERPSSVPPPGEAKSEPPPGEQPKRRFDSRLPGLLRRGIEKSIEAGLYTFAKSLETGDAVREKIGEVKIPEMATAVGKALQEARLPREIAGALLGQLDETKNDVVRIIAREVRDFLEATDLAGEIKAALTSLSFEVRTEVRFIPNDKGTGVRPDVRARGRVKRSDGATERRVRRRPAGAGARDTPDELDEADEEEET